MAAQFGAGRLGGLDEMVPVAHVRIVFVGLVA